LVDVDASDSPRAPVQPPVPETIAALRSVYRDGRDRSHPAHNARCTVDTTARGSAGPMSPGR